MKKILITLVAAMALTTSAFAEGFIIKGGLTYGNLMSKGLVEDLKTVGMDIKSFTGWHAGIGYQTGSIAGLSFQPELQYNLRGMSTDGIANKVNYKYHYLELPVNIQWGIDLIVARPFLLVSPYVGCCLDGTGMPTDTNFSDRLEYGFGAGAGIELWILQITARYNWNFGHLPNVGDFWKKVIGKKTNGAFELSVAFCF